MADAKIQIKLGSIEFSGEGEESWVAAQLDKILSQAPQLLKIAPPSKTSNNNGTGSSEGGIGDIDPSTTLGTFLKNKNVGSSQVNRFLATAIWLHSRGNKTPTTSDITKALSDNHQTKLSNSTDCLNQNIQKGYCEKQGKQFYVTPEGFESMK